MALRRCKGCGIMIDTETSPEGIAICETCYSDAQVASDEGLKRQR